MTKIRYSTNDLMPVTVGGKEVLVLSAESVWVIHPENEELFIEDSKQHGFTAVKVPAVPVEEDAKVLDWPKIITAG
jgi:hypothetical protein